jgi:hypothetical protein
MHKQGSTILELLIGRKNQWFVLPRWTIALELVQEFRKGSLEGSAFEVDAAIQLISVLLLSCAHCSRSSMGSVGEGKDVSGVGGDRDCNIIRKVLRSIEADEAVNTHAFVSTSFRAKLRVGGKSLTGEAIDAVQY